MLNGVLFKSWWDTIQQVDSEAIEDKILELEECAGRALILEVELPIKKCNFMQAYYPDDQHDDGKGYEVELSLLNESSFRLYRYRTVDVREVITIFLNYFENQQVPDITTWEDMTNELN